MKSNKTIFPDVQPTVSSCWHCRHSFHVPATLILSVVSDNMTHHMHISNVCLSAFVEIRRISFIRQYLTVEGTKNLVCAFVIFKLDRCYSLPSGCPVYILSRLTKIENSAAKVIFKPRNREHKQHPL